MNRCPWLPANLPLYVDYHDSEWGVPSRDPRHLFEMLCLEGAQAGLSWWTVLQKRQRYREVFQDFEPERVAAMGDRELEALAGDPGIIRHRGKILSVRGNARAWLALSETVDPVEWLWAFVGGETVTNRWRTLAEYPAKTPVSEAMAKALRKAGFNFVGPAITYAFMQAVGMVDDHSADCFRAKNPRGGR